MTPLRGYSGRPGTITEVMRIGMDENGRTSSSSSGFPLLNLPPLPRLSFFLSIRSRHRTAMPTQAVELLILGAGWTSTFLIPLLKSSNVSFAATSRDGRVGTIPFDFDPSSGNVEQYKSLPDAMTVLITFPVTENVKALVDGYHGTRSGTIERYFSANWIQLGSTGSFVKVRSRCSALLPTDVLIWKDVS